MPEFYILIIFGVWLTGISIYLVGSFIFFDKLKKGLGSPDLKRSLDRIFEQDSFNKKELSELKKRISRLETEGEGHVQKIGLVRFNPFKELGGDHSFCLAILDGHDSGVVVTGLHTRDRTRIYMKDIKNGKSSLELSNDEKRAVASAQKK